MLSDYDDGFCLFLNNTNSHRRGDYGLGDHLHLSMLDQEALLKQRQAILNIIDRLILNGSVLFERSQISNQVADEEDNANDSESIYMHLYNGPPALNYDSSEEKKTGLKKKKLVNTVNCNNFKQSLHQRNIVACCVDTILKINELMDKGLIDIERLKIDLVESEKSGGDLYADFDGELEYVESHQVKLSIDETDNWISRYVFYRYAKTFNVEESCYTMSRSQFDKFLTHLREVMGERGLGQDILVIKDVLDEGDEHLDGVDPFEDDSIAASLASTNQIVLDVGSILAELKQNRTITEGAFLNWFQSVLVLYIMFKYNQYCL